MRAENAFIAMNVRTARACVCDGTTIASGLGNDAAVTEPPPRVGNFLHERGRALRDERAVD